MAFSWTEVKKKVVEKKIERAIIMAKVGQNTDFKLQHPDWVRDAQSKNYTDLKKKVREQVERKQENEIKRRQKFV